MNKKPPKENVAEYVASKVKDGDCLGLGTGSSAESVIRAIGGRIARDGIKISGVSTSSITTSVASEMGILVLPTSSHVKLDWGFDGADEVAPDKALLKGRGGALLKEKIVALLVPKLFVVVTEEKLVTRIGERFPIPVEVVPEAVDIVSERLTLLGAKSVVLRTGSNFYGPLFTESGNHILDASFELVNESICCEIKACTGVVEHGVFSANSSFEVVCGYADGNVKTW